MEPLVTIEECTVGTGDLCGSTFLDAAFEEYLRGRLGERALSLLTPRRLDAARKEFSERIKFRFNPSDPENEFFLDFPEISDDSTIGLINESLILPELPSN